MMSARKNAAVPGDTWTAGSGPADPRPVLLVLLGAFWPGNDASGPVKSFRTMAQALRDRFAFRVVARDRPFGATEALAAAGVWQQRDTYQILYCAQAARCGVAGLGHVLRSTPHDLLLLNGFYDHEFTIPALVLRRLGRVPRRPTILSTRGEFADGAQGLKSSRKRAYSAFAQHTGLLRNVQLHATTDAEAADVERRCSFSAGIRIAPVISPLAPLVDARQPGRHGDPLRVAFLGRISRVKNVDYALKVLQQVQAPVMFDLYGPIQDQAYWAECQSLVSKLPAHVTVTHKGEIPNDDVPRTINTYDLFFLPTTGENFGHAIAEALAAAVPVLISDRTPWRDLEAKQAGWALSLDAPSAFAERINQLAHSSDDCHKALRQGARLLAEREARVDQAIAANADMLLQALDCGHSR